jgi:hypothetical protein
MRKLIVVEWMALDGVGSYRRPGQPTRTPLQLVNSQVTSTRAILATYAPAGA